MCAQSCFNTVDRILLRLTVPKGHHRFSCCQRPVNVALHSGSSRLTVDDAHWTPPPFQVATGSESSGDGLGVLEDDRCIEQGSSSNATSHELVFACSPPPPRAQISHTILTQAARCAIRVVARCELGLLPVIKTAQTGARVYWH